MRKFQIKKKLSMLLNNPSLIQARLKKFKPIYFQHALIAKSLLKEPIKTCIDVGANRGEFSRVCKYLFPESKIYAFEPLPKYKKVLGSLKINFFSFGLWNRNQVSSFFYNKDRDRRSSFLESTSISNQRQIQKIEIEQKRFDSLDIKIIRPSYLKIDVEGAENKVLEGFGKKLREIDVLQVEVNFEEGFHKQTHFLEIFKIAKKAGFIGFVQDNIYLKIKNQ